MVSPLEKEVIELVATILRKDPQTITRETVLEDIAADSIEMFGLISAFEERFHTTTDYEDLIHIERIGDIITLIENKKNSIK